MFSCKYCEFFKKGFFYRIPPVAAFLFTRKERIGKCGKRREEKIFKWKKKMKTFHLTSTCKFWCKLKQKCKYNYVNIRTAHPLSLKFSTNFLSFDSCVFIFCVFISDKLKNISLLHLLVYSGIESCSVKQLLGKTLELVSFQYSLLNKKVYKYIKSEILRRYSSSVMVKASILQLYKTAAFLAQCNKNTRHMENQIITLHIIFIFRNQIFF